jgi:cytochrome c553
MKGFITAILLCGIVVLCNSFLIESDLSKLMRTMTSDAKKLREKVQKGDKIPMFYKKYKRIYTVSPSSDNKKGDEFDALARAFLTNCERLHSSDDENRKLAYNAMVTACIRCHEKYCPGPLSMLKRMILP